MMKMTFTRIKRVCAIAFVPRILRGELRFAPGKFEKPAYVIKKIAHKSTKSSKPSSKKYRRKAPEDSQKYGVSTVCENSVKPEFLDAVTITRHRKRKPNTDIPRDESSNVVTDSIYKEGPACRCDKCNQLKDDNVSVSGVPPLYIPTPACRCNDCRRVIADIFGESETTSIQYERNIPNDYVANIAQCNIVNESDNHKLITDHRTLPGTSYNISDTEEHKTMKKEIQPEEDNSLVKDLRTSPRHDTILMNKENNYDTNLYTNLYDVAPEENKPSLKLDPKDAILSNQKTYETLYCKPNIAIDPETLNIYRSLKAKNTNFEDTEAGKNNTKYYEETLQPLSTNNDKSDSVLNATTHKQDEEKLVQKIEQIEQPLIDEAEKSKVDSANVVPKVLGNVEKAVNFTDQVIDEMAKRCLNSKDKQVDKILLREIGKLSIPITGQKSSISTKEIESEMSTLRPEYNVQTSKPEDQLTKQYLYDLNRTQIADDAITKPAILQSTVSNPNRKPFIASKYKRLGKHPKTPTEIGSIQPDSNLNKATWGNQLDPNHVLTCNETCPISPKFITDSVLSRHDDAQSIYERNFTTKDTNNEELLLECEGFSDHNGNRISTVDEISDSKTKNYKLDEYGNVPQNELKDNNVTTLSPSKFQIQHTTPADAYEILLSKEATVSDTSRITGKAGKEVSSIKDRNIAKNSNKNEETVGYEYNENEHSDEGRRDLKRIENATGQLQATSEQLLATTDQLQAKSEKLNTATQILQETTEKLKRVSLEDINAHLKEASEKLRSAGKKFETCADDLESTTEKLQNMCDNFERTILSHLERPLDDRARNATIYPINPSIMSSVASNIVTSRNSTSAKSPSTQVPLSANNRHTSNLDKSKTDSKQDKDKLSTTTTACSSNLASLTQPSDNLNSMPVMADQLPIAPVGPLPEINEETKLSELMKLVKERNKIIEHSHFLMSQGKKSVPPLSMPMQNAPVKVKPGYPELKFKPKVCNPKTPKPKVKCSKFDPITLGIDQDPRSFNYQRMDNIFYQGVAITEDLMPPINFTDEMILQLKNVGNVVKSTYHQKKMEALESVMLLRSPRRSNRSRLFRSKDFEPWTPIPSWPHSKHKKQGRPKLQCPKDGCKSFPPTRSEHDPPCGLWPCDSFPTFPKRKFSQLDYFTVFLTRNRIIDLVENKDSPMLSRSFFKTEWTIPKYTEKPHTTARKNKENVKIPAPKEKDKISPKQYNSKNNTNIFPQKTIAPVGKNLVSVPAQTPILNLERLLLPTMASVCYAINRYYEGNIDTGDILHCKPHPNFPIEEYSNSNMGQSKNAKYLLLTFNSDRGKEEIF